MEKQELRKNILSSGYSGRLRGQVSLYRLLSSSFLRAVWEAVRSSIAGQVDKLFLSLGSLGGIHTN